MAVDLSAWCAIERNEFVHKVLRGLLRAAGIALEIGEAKLGDRASSNLSLEEIHFVEEQNERRVFEPV